MGYQKISEMLLLPDYSPLDGAYKCRYNVHLINSLILYIGHMSIDIIRSKRSGALNDATMEIFVNLVITLDAEGRYYVLNAIANQLRYPNNNTHFFSCVLLVLFEAGQEDSARKGGPDRQDISLKEPKIQILGTRLYQMRARNRAALPVGVEKLHAT